MSETTALTRAPSAPPPALTAPSMDFGSMMALSEQLVASGFLPDHIKRPAQAVAIILAGQELGLPPMRALRSLVMVKGKITESADSQLGRFKAAGGRAQFVTLTDTLAELHLVHPNGDTHTERFSLEDAKRAGLAGQGSMYAKYPKAMLRSRAITGGLKSVGWDGGAGVYDPSELQIEAAAGTDDAEAEPISLDERLILVRADVTLDDALQMRVGKDKTPLAEMAPSGVAKVRAWAWNTAIKSDAEGKDVSNLLALVAACDVVTAHVAKLPSDEAREAEGVAA